MPIKKSELYSSLWKSCDELRGGMDASQYKDYVLVLLFVKYVSDKYAGDTKALISVPSGGSFSDMVALKGSPEIGDTINKIIGRLAEANNLKGVIDQADFNSDDKLGRGKEKVDRLTKLITIYENPALDFSSNRAEGDDLLGDAYEYLISNFAKDSGKSKGNFFTPSEVSRIMAKVIGITAETKRSQTIYDPTGGSGSLILKGADEAPHGLTIYMQEKDNTTAGLARMNMILHNQPTAEIWNDNTLTNPHFPEKDGSLKTFDFGVSNPPFSDKAWRNGMHPEQDPYDRFEDGIPPNKNGDYAFLLHLLRSLKSTGKGAIILPHGVLFRGGSEGEIRRNLIRRGVIKGIIGLPPNLFFGTSIPACIVVLDKESAAARNGIFMIDASKGFMKDGNKNRLRHRDIHKIVDAFVHEGEIPRYSRMVLTQEIEANDFNLNIPRYIDATDPEDLQDIDAHLHGGIPEADVAALDQYWEVCPGLKKSLFSDASRSGYFDLTVGPDEVKQVISDNPDFTRYIRSIEDRFDEWKSRVSPLLTGIKADTHLKTLIHTISEDLLGSFSGFQLIDPYDLYQHLMDYWTETMQDDVYLVVSDGWSACVNGKPSVDLLSPGLVISRFFAEEQELISDMEAERDEFSRQMEELFEEHGGEDGLLSDVLNDKGKVTKGNIKTRIAVIKKDSDAVDELKVLTEYLGLIEDEAALSKKIKEAQKKLDTKVLTRYASLTEHDVISLVVSDKWMATLSGSIREEIDRISQGLSSRIKILATRYAEPLPKIEAEVVDLSVKVEDHLKRMGFVV
nr:type I restriction-modification system subunit M [uncultured Methanospirillum sp.]